MKAEDFYYRFEGLDLQVSQLGNNAEVKRNEVKRLGQGLETKKFMQRVLTGLKRTPNHSDPGKYGPAFYFVAVITHDDIRRAEEPSLFETCLQCKIDQPVLMWYKQTYDSPWGDTWEKEAFIMCKEDGVHKLAHFCRDCRF